MATLRNRETQILALKSQGMTDHQVARKLQISRHTVRTHLRNARARTDRTTMELVCAVASHGGTGTK